MNTLIFLSLILSVYCTNNAQVSTNYETLGDIAESYINATELEKTINSQAKEEYITKLEQECKILASNIEELNLECKKKILKHAFFFLNLKKNIKKNLLD